MQVNHLLKSAKGQQLVRIIFNFDYDCELSILSVPSKSSSHHIKVIETEIVLSKKHFVELSCCVLRITIYMKNFILTSGAYGASFRAS